jgi:Phosphoesterase family
MKARLSLLLAVACCGCSLVVTPVDPASRDPAPRRQGQRHLDRVVIVVFENKDASEILRDSYMAGLKARGAYFEDFRGLFHNSYPNYLAMVGGRLFDEVDRGNSDKQVTIPGADTNIGDRLEAQRRTWKAYAEDYPVESPPFLGDRSGLFTRRHIPFLSFESVTGDSARTAAHVVGVRSGDPENEFARDVAAGHLPDYTFYVPNMWNDAHDKPWPWASRWLRSFLSHGGWVDRGASADREGPCFGPGTGCFPSGTLIVVTFDESARRGHSNHIYTAFLGDVVRPGSVVPWAANHYNVLATIEANFGLAPLGAGDAGAKLVEGIWADR